MAAIPLILPYVGAAMSVIGAIQQGQAAKDSASYNAAVSQRNATIATQQAGADEDRQRREITQRLGALRAGYGASGITLEGSPIDIIEMSAQNGELSALTTRYKGQLKALGYTETAALDEMQGDQAETAGYAKAGSELIKFAGDQYVKLNRTN